MKAIDILNNLTAYENLLKEIQQRETAFLKNKEGFIKLTRTLESSYSFITLELESVTGNPEDPVKMLYCEIRFEVTYENKVICKSVYCEDKSRTGEMENFIKEKESAHKFTWTTSSSLAIYLNKETTGYLNMADEIAQQAYNCASGDDYRPGFFSKIYLQEDGIRLEQVNHMNSRSTAHKDNYSLRRLEFFLPFTPQEKTYRYEYQLGNLLIAFSDSSSDNNKPCGKAIESKIEELVSKYEKK